MAKEYGQLEGKWNTVSMENLEELLDVIKAPFLLRKAAPRLKPVQIISFDGTVMKIRIETSLKTKESCVPVDGSQFEEETFGKKFIGQASVCDGTLIRSEGMLDDVHLVAERYVDSDDRMILKTVVGDVTCTRVFCRA